jgi:Tol biopolymer transport system component
MRLVVWASVIVCSALAAGCGQAAKQASVPEQDPVLAFNRCPQGSSRCDSEVWLLGRDWSARRVAQGEQGGWSPDGSGLAVVTRPGLAIYDVVSGRLRERLKANVTDAVWSPTADQIGIATAELNLPFSALAVIDSEQGPPLKVGSPWDANSIRFAWSPDGRQLIYTSCFYNGRPGDGAPEICELFAVGADGQNKRALVSTVHLGGAADFAWSPGGGEIAIGGSDGLFIFELGSAKLRRLLRHRLWDFAWSPDGRWLAYTLGKPNAIQLISRDGKQRKVLLVPARVVYTDLAWSPDGDLIAAAASRTEFSPHLGLHVIDVRTGKMLHRTSGDDWSPAWRPH